MLQLATIAHGISNTRQFNIIMRAWSVKQDSGQVMRFDRNQSLCRRMKCMVDKPVEHTESGHISLFSHVMFRSDFVRSQNILRGIGDVMLSLSLRLRLSEQSDFSHSQCIFVKTDILGKYS